MNDSLSRAFGLMLLTVVLAIVIIISFVVKYTYELATENVVESKFLVKPNYRLEANNKKIDTIYIYNFK